MAESPARNAGSDACQPEDPGSVSRARRGRGEVEVDVWAVDRLLLPRGAHDAQLAGVGIAGRIAEATGGQLSPPQEVSVRGQGASALAEPPRATKKSKCSLVAEASTAGGGHAGGGHADTAAQAGQVSEAAPGSGDVPAWAIEAIGILAERVRDGSFAPADATKFADEFELGCSRD